MEAGVKAAIIAAITSFLVALVTQYWKQRAEQETNRHQINLKYLNPLRLQLEENYFRLSEILDKLDNENDGRCKPLLSISDAKEVSNKEVEWFNGEGCYLISSCYFTACLFFSIKKVREDLPYLRLGKNKDTHLINLMFKVSYAFLQNLGVFYVTQYSIGNDMYLPQEDRIMSYREFCQTLQQPEKRAWFDRLINFYIETGQGINIERVKKALVSINNLSIFLDKNIERGGSNSIQDRLQSEQIALKRRRNKK